ncbi:redox-regulated ATPase YchF [candidate division CSSED10-310 bacterium]|uniref:Ribosome-binding ATPase YchF n=1 Tax=candidate division CSSED10-310 bacterium TaxID=2855610 RepID=A0ABV6YRI6_UNCC1
MGFTAGIIGLPNVGKTTIFNALTAVGAEASSYPFCTIEPNTARVPFTEHRLQTLVSLVAPPKWAAATIQFMDVAGLVKGASKGEGLGNQFLGHIRTVDILIHVVRCFENSKVAHVEGVLTPVADMETVNTELLLADLETLHKRTIKIKKLIRGGDKKLIDTLKIIERIEMALDQGQPARSVPLLTGEEARILKELDLLTAKEVLYLANVDEGDLQGQSSLGQQIQQQALEEGAEFLTLCGDLEASISEMDPEEQDQFRQEYTLSASSLERLVATVVSKLKLIVFYTIVGQAVRSWIIPENTAARKAAGRIHTDMEKGFIKAEVLAYDTLISAGSWSDARQEGFIRQEGKHYLVQDGDIVLFRFNV